MNEAFGKKVEFEDTLDGWQVTLPASRVSLIEVIQAWIKLSIGVGFLGAIWTAINVGTPPMSLAGALTLVFAAIGAALGVSAVRQAVRMVRAHRLELAGESLRIQPLVLGRPVGKPTMHPLATLGPVEASGPFWDKTIALAPDVHVPVFVQRDQVEDLVVELGRHIREARTARRLTAPPPKALQGLRGQAND